MKRTYYITTAIDYVNSLPHIGTAYEKITADCIARAKRLLGYDVRFCMGTDEHSINVKKKAVEEGLTPLEYCDRMVPKFEDIWARLAISYDDFIRTTEARHKVAVRELFRRIQERGDIEIAHYEGWYCEGCEAFIQEKDLVDGACPNHQRPPTWIEEENYFFKLSRYAGRLLDHIRANPDFIRPESRRNEIIRLIEGGLDDISVSRSGFDWGIPLPNDPSHVVYVWFDALINYISSLGFGSDDETLMEKYWPADLHVIGKDITRFHCVIWPAMLMSGGVPVPKSVFGHGFIYHRGEKMSKSLGNVVAPLDIVDAYGPDPLRYFMLREVVYGQDGDFTYERFIERYNSDLANDLGNLVSRTLSMIDRYLGGRLPVGAIAGKGGISFDFNNYIYRWTQAIENLELSKACDIVFEYIRSANRVIEEKAPWNLAKDDAKRDELTAVLCDLANAIVGIAKLIAPYMPVTAEEIWRRFHCDGSVRDRPIELETILRAPCGVTFEKGAPLFPRIEQVSGEITPNGELSTDVIKREEKMEEQKPVEPAQEKTAAPTVKDTIEFDDFLKLDFRIGTVLTAERVDGSNKLLRLRVDDGLGGRTILAGLAKDIAPEDIAGRQVVFVANLKPRKMMGELSEGMVLAAADADGRFTVLGPARPAPPGSAVS